MMHGLLLRVLQERELGNPQKLKVVLLQQILLSGQLQAEIAQDIPDHFILVSRKQKQIAGLALHSLRQAVKLLLFHKFGKRGLEGAVLLDGQISQSFGSEALGELYQGVDLLPGHGPLPFGIDAADAAALSQSILKYRKFAVFYDLRHVF